jgi:multisubunit Na+/H+ antiporter MnhC subunit
VNDPSGRSTPANWLRFIASGVLVLGLASAYAFYRVRSQSVAPTLDDLLPGYSERRARQTGILMGGFVASMLEGADKLKEPATQALIIAAVAVVVALCCFRVASLMERPADDGEDSGSDRQI